MLSMDWFRIYIEVQSFSVFPRWGLFRMTFDVIFMTKTFYRMSSTNFENFMSIRPRVAEKVIFKMQTRTFGTRTWLIALPPFSLRERRVTTSPQFTNLVSDQVNPPWTCCFYSPSNGCRPSMAAKRWELSLWAYLKLLIQSGILPYSTLCLWHPRPIAHVA